MKFTGKWQGHQGDVQIFSIDELPKGAKKIKKGFIAKSEKTGNVHALCGDYEMYEVPETNSFVVEVGTDGATLNHTGLQELTPEYWDKNTVFPYIDHKPTTFTKGLYYIGIQRRKKPFSKVWQKVID